MTIDPIKLKAVRERFIIDKMATLEPKRRQNQRTYWEWSRLRRDLNQIRLARGEAPIDPDDDEQAAYDVMLRAERRDEPPTNGEAE